MRAFIKRLLPLVAVFALPATGVLAQQSDRAPDLNPGDLIVTGFSGTMMTEPGRTLPRGKSAADFTFIDTLGASARIFDISRAGSGWDGRLIAPPLKFEVPAKDVGQVFGVALDDATPPNVYLSATSMFGLNLVSRRRDGGVDRRMTGGPGAGWMKGQFGLDLQGGPGAIYKIDGRTGVPTLFANVTLDGVPNPGSGLGNLAFDSAHRQLFVSDLYTGMIHRFDLTGKELGVYDHGTTGLRAGDLPAVAFNARNRPNIASEHFDTRKPDTWGFAPAARRVWALAVRENRLYYSVLSGPQVWSVGIAQDGSFARDPRRELDVTSQGGALAVTDIAFTPSGEMILAQRAPIAASVDYSAFTRPAEPQVLRFSRKRPNGPPSPGRWRPSPDEYAVGYAGRQRNANGGVALGYGYRPDGAIDTRACDAVLWATGQNLRNNPALRSELERGGPLVVHGLQSGPESLVRRDDKPVINHRFVDYDGKFDDPRASGHLGSVRVYTQPCAPAVYVQPAPAALPIPFPVAVPVGGDRKVCTPTCVCPPGTAMKGGECVKTDACPPPMIPGPIPGQCVCPQGTTLQGNQCVPTQGCSPGQVLQNGVCVPIGSTPLSGCTPPMIPGPTPGSCHCPLDMQMMNGQCVPPNPCKPPFVPGPTPGSCVCPKGTALQNGTCVAQVCPAPMVPGPCTCPEGTVLDGQFCVKATPIDLKVEKTGETSPPPDVPWYGWHLKVTNVGAGINANGVITISDVVPAGMQFDSASSTPPTDWSCNAPPTIPAGGTLTCTYNGGPASAGQVLSTIDIVAKAIGNGPYPPFTNCATVAVGGGYVDTNAGNNQSCVTVTKPTQIGEITLKKEVDNKTSITLPNLQYPVTVNCGGADQNVMLYANVPQTIGNVPVPGTCTVTENPPPPPNVCPPNTTATWATSINPSSPISITSASTNVTVTNTFSCEPGGGVLIIKKQVVNNTSGDLSGWTYPIDVNCGGGVLTSISLPDGGSQTINNIAQGTICSANENTVALPPNACSGDTVPVWSASGPSAMIGASPKTITVVNTLSCQPNTGVLTVVKHIVNNTPTPSLPPITFPVTATCGYPPVTWPLNVADNVPQTINGLPVPSICSVHEDLPPAPTGVCAAGYAAVWGLPAYSPANFAITATPTTVNVQNTLNCVKSDDVGTLVVHKSFVNKTGHSMSTAGLTFPATVTCGPPANLSQSVTLSANGAYTLNNVAYGSICTVSETMPIPVPPGVCGPGQAFYWYLPLYTPSNTTVINAPSTTVDILNAAYCIQASAMSMCPQGGIRIGNDCVTTTKCVAPTQPGAAYGSCVCASGSTRKDGNCVVTKLECRSPLVPNAAGTACGCPAGMSPGAVPGQCMCPKDSKLKDGKCLPKKTTKQVDKKKDKKTEKKTARSCPEGTVRRKGECVRRNQPSVSTDDVIRGIGIGIGVMRGIGGHGGGGGGGGGIPSGGGGGKR